MSKIIAGEIQKFFKKLKAEFVAVRSSATAEDSSSVAWAGQLEITHNTQQHNNTHTKSGYLDTCVCAIFDGREFHLGLSSCFEYPTSIVKEVLKRGLTVSEAAKKLGFSQKKDLGAQEGMIGILTKGRLNRSEYTYQAILTAMIHLENKEFYKK